MREIRTSGLMSGVGKRGGASGVSARAQPRLYHDQHFERQSTRLMLAVVE
jgi:hypothetical protein